MRTVFLVGIYNQPQTGDGLRSINSFSITDTKRLPCDVSLGPPGRPDWTEPSCAVVAGFDHDWKDKAASDEIYEYIGVRV